MNLLCPPPPCTGFDSTSRSDRSRASLVSGSCGTPQCFTFRASVNARLLAACLWGLGLQSLVAKNEKCLTSFFSPDPRGRKSLFPLSFLWSAKNTAWWGTVTSPVIPEMGLGVQGGVRRIRKSQSVLAP